jgi:steroid 5-alpha reductase family enzyme
MIEMLFFRISDNMLLPLDLQPGSAALTLVTVMLLTALLCFAVSEITRNYSQVDKLWSIMPIIYCIIVLWNYPSPRLWLMTALVTIWGIRLSLNFGRKGGYSLIPWRGEEDYRWKIMRERPELKGRFRFGLFNLLFISLYQNFLILLFSSPLLIAVNTDKSGLNATDIAAAAIMLLFMLVETVADNQQFAFQKLKKQNVGSDPFYNQSLKAGFVCDGLWKHVRHPNFISEQMIWIGIYLFGVASTGRWLNWTIAGSVLLVLLFQGSTQLTEKISSGKYPAYADYKRRVPRFFPGIFRSSSR